MQRWKWNGVCRGVAVAILVGLTPVAFAQSSDSTGLSAGAPPLPTGVWDANGAASGLSSTFTSQNTSISNTLNTVNNTTSAAAAAAASPGTSVVSAYVLGDSLAGQYETVIYGICSSKSTPYVASVSENLVTGVSTPVYASPTTPGLASCPSDMPYFYPQYIDVIPEETDPGGVA